MAGKLRQGRQRITDGYATLKRSTRPALWGAGIASVVIFAGPSLVDGPQEGSSSTPAANSPAETNASPATAKTLPGTGKQILLKNSAELFNQPDDTTGHCAYIPEAESVEQIGKPKNGMVAIKTPAEGDGFRDNYIDMPFEKDCSPRTWVRLGDIAVSNSK